MHLEILGWQIQVEVLEVAIIQDLEQQEVQELL